GGRRAEGGGQRAEGGNAGLPVARSRRERRPMRCESVCQCGDVAAAHGLVLSPHIVCGPAVPRCRRQWRVALRPRRRFLRTKAWLLWRAVTISGTAPCKFLKEPRNARVPSR